ncbi:MAG TPA: hypothetical protein VIW02_09720, partial [Gammaproteobacteria bacterium]
MEPVELKDRLETRLGRHAFGGGTLVLGMLLALSGAGMLYGWWVLSHAPQGDNPAPLLWMGVLFLAVGLAALPGAWRGYRFRRRARLLSARFPDAPWWADYPWQPAGIDDTTQQRWKHQLGGTLVLSLFLLPVNALVLTTPHAGLMVWVVALVFDGVLLLAAGGTVYTFLQAQKYGRIRLAFERFPFAPGEALEVRLATGRLATLTATLRYVNEYPESSGGRSRTRRTRSFAYHEETRQVATLAGAREVPLRFQLPDEPEWVTRLTSDRFGAWYWELEVVAEQPGIDYRATFPLPVYAQGHRVRHDATQPPPQVHAPEREPTRRVAKTVAALLVLGAFAWTFAPWLPGWLAGLGLQPLTVEDPAPGEEMDVRVAGDGRAWVLSKYGLTRYTDGRGEALFAREQVAGGDDDWPRYVAFSTLLVDGPDQAWIGGWTGELLRYRDGEWRLVARRGNPLQQRITALAWHDDALWVAGAGLWRLDADGGALRPAAGFPFPRRQVGALASDSAGRLHASVGDELWRLDAAGWRR